MEPNIQPDKNLTLDGHRDLGSEGLAQHLVVGFTSVHSVVVFRLSQEHKGIFRSCSWKLCFKFSSSVLLNLNNKD